jgi:hypothetical protein
LDRCDSLAALGFANRGEPRRVASRLLVCGDADADAERRSGSSRRFCASDRCRLHDGCIKAIKAAGKLKSSKKRVRRMTRLGGVRCVCGVPVQKGCVNNKKKPWRFAGRRSILLSMRLYRGVSPTVKFHLARVFGAQGSGDCEHVSSRREPHLAEV